MKLTKPLTNAELHQAISQATYDCLSMEFEHDAASFYANSISETVMDIVQADIEIEVREAQIKEKISYIDDNYPNLNYDTRETTYTQVNWVIREAREYWMDKLLPNRIKMKETK